MGPTTHSIANVAINACIKILKDIPSCKKTDYFFNVKKINFANYLNAYAILSVMLLSKS